MLDLAWVRHVLELEGLGDWRVCVGPQAHGGVCCQATREIVLPGECGPGLALHEITHAKAGVRWRHGLRWQDELTKLIDEHTVEVWHGPIGLEG